jgi:hypothetical protein
LVHTVIVPTRFIPQCFDAVTCWPFIFVRPEWRQDAALIEHEMVHYKEQRNCGVLPWLLLYACSKAFRLGAEVRGYKAQIKAHGITADEAAQYLMRYGTDITRERALAMLA